jgi:hypothetical protein
MEIKSGISLAKRLIGDLNNQLDEESQILRRSVFIVR